MWYLLCLQSEVLSIGKSLFIGVHANSFKPHLMAMLMYYLQAAIDTPLSGSGCLFAHAADDMQVDLLAISI